MNLDDLRVALEERGLDHDDLLDDPMAQFETWFGASRGWGLYLPEAMVLSTVDADGRPSSRQVLLRGVDVGFVFFTNLESRKARDIEKNPQVSLCFGWHVIQRQVRVVGSALRLTAEESDAYFVTRPRGSQIGAWASPQSQVIADRAVLEARVAEVEQRFEGGPLPRPSNWGGYRVVPDEIEFWQGRRHRLHDRFRYARLVGDDAEAAWRIERLAP